MAHFVVDGMNVFGSRPDGWWRDRDGAVRRLAEDLRAVAARGGTVTVVFDGTELPDLPEGEHGGVVVFYAGRRGRDGADDRIVELVAAEPDPGHVTVVTSDRGLADRVSALGAGVRGAGGFLAELGG